MDRITESLVKDFAQNNELSLVNSNKDQFKRLFEEFATYSVIAKVMDNDFTFNDIDGMQIGNSNDAGIDSIAIMINGELVNTVQEIEDIFNTNGTSYEVMVVFIQAKTSSKFEGVQLRNFGDGILDFLKENPDMLQNDDLKEKWQIILY